MRKMTVVLVALLVLSIGAVAADEVPKVQFFGAYSLQGFDSKADAFGTGRQIFHGWDSEMQLNLHKNIGFVANFGGYYNDQKGTQGGLSAEAKLRNYPVLFGPRVTARVGKVEPFVHALFGITHTTVDLSVTGVSTSKDSSNDFAFALGGGVDFKVTKHLGIRPFKFDYLRIRTNAGSTNINFNNYRFATGIVLSF